MAGRHLGRAICLRHGRSDYSGQFPELTKEGFAQARDIGKMLRQRFCPRRTRHVIITSPTPRAHGTALTLRTVWGSGEEVRLEPLIRTLDIRDMSRAVEFFKKHFKGDIHEVDRLFVQGGFYDDESVWEGKPAIANRRDDFFGRLAADMQREDRSVLRVAVSHFEVLHEIPARALGIDFLKEHPLRNCEPIELSFSEGKDSHQVSFTVEFRGQVSDPVSFDVKQRTFLW